MARYSLFVLKVPLNTDKTNKTKLADPVILIFESLVYKINKLRRSVDVGSSVFLGVSHTHLKGAGPMQRPQIFGSYIF